MDSKEVEVKTKIYGYYFDVTVEKGDVGYIAFAPGVGGVYEEGATIDEAKANAYEAACAILEARFERNDPIIQESKYLKLITAPPSLNAIADIRDISDGYISTRTPVLPGV